MPGDKVGRGGDGIHTFPPRPAHQDIDKRNEAMVRAWRAGATVTEISREFGLTLGWTGRVLRRNGANLSSKGRGIKKLLDATKVVDDYLAGAPIREIATKLDVSYGKIYRLLQEEKVPMRPRSKRRQQP